MHVVWNRQMFVFLQLTVVFNHGKLNKTEQFVWVINKGKQMPFVFCLPGGNYKPKKQLLNIWGFNGVFIYGEQDPVCQ